MEAGNSCFDFRVPEEINRRIVDVISDVNLTYSKIARQYLIDEGFSKNRVINTGSPMKEVLDFYANKIKKSNILKSLNLKKNYGKLRSLPYIFKFIIKLMFKMMILNLKFNFFAQNKAWNN